MSRCRKTVAFIWVVCLSLIIPFQTLGANDPSILKDVEHDAVLENFINSKGIQVNGLIAEQAINQHYKGDAIKDNGLKANVLWYDLAANLSRLNTRESVQELLDKTKKARIDTIVLDVKNYTGFVGYKSRLAPHISTSTNPRYQNIFPGDYDLLATVLEEAHARGIKVHAAVNVFSEGNNEYKDGPAFRHPEWQSQFYYEKQVITAPNESHQDFSTFINPLVPEVRKYELDIMKEIVANYDVDGLVLDRARYSNIYADFSDLSRSEFETYIGKEVHNWPTDIFTVSFTDAGTQINAGPLFKKWIEWRAHIIYNFFADAKALVKSMDNKVDFSTYVGSWYPYYYSEGVNWGSQDYHPDEPWASEDYNKYGYAGLLDFIMTGLYYRDITIEEALAKGNPEWMSVEGAGHLSTEVIKQDTFVYGSLYLLQYKDQPVRFKQALKKTLETTNGIMIFDLSYLEMYDWWYILEDVLKPSNPPHENPGLKR